MRLRAATLCCMSTVPGQVTKVAKLTSLGMTNHGIPGIRPGPEAREECARSGSHGEAAASRQPWEQITWNAFCCMSAYVTSKQNNPSLKLGGHLWALVTQLRECKCTTKDSESQTFLLPHTSFRQQKTMQTQGSMVSLARKINLPNEGKTGGGMGGNGEDEHSLGVHN